MDDGCFGLELDDLPSDGLNWNLLLRLLLLDERDGDVQVGLLGLPGFRAYAVFDPTEGDDALRARRRGGGGRGGKGRR